MKRVWITLFGGVLVALLAYFGFYFAGTAHSRALEKSHEPELAWLQREFHLNQAEFAHICQMHEAYLTGCAERCHRIDMKGEELKHLLASTNNVTPEIEKALAESALLRADCQKKMLQHFYDVSRTMPPAQGQRYLAWVQARTILCESHSQMHQMHHSN